MRTIEEMIPLTHTSRRLYESVKLSDRRAHELAAAVGIDATLLSLVLNKHRKVRVNDPRFIELGRILGLEQADIFEPIKKTSHGKKRAANGKIGRGKKAAA